MMLAAERRKEILRLRIAGKSYDQIADAIGMAKSAVYAALNNELHHLANETRESAVHLRELEALRLDAALAAIWPRVLDGDLKAIDRYISISKRISDLWGLDQPKKLWVGTDEEAKPLTIKINVVKKENLNGHHEPINGIAGSDNPDAIG